jgi:hypothetical protein
MRLNGHPEARPYEERRMREFSELHVKIEKEERGRERG